MLDLIDSEAVLETERLKLEPLTPSHALPLFPILSDERIYTYIPDNPPWQICKSGILESLATQWWL